MTSKPTLTIGQRLKMAREIAGVTQQELADHIKISRESIQHIEGGRTKNPRNIEPIAKFLNVSASWLRFGDKNIDKLDKESLEFATAFNNLPTEARKVISATLKALKPKK